MVVDQSTAVALLTGPVLSLLISFVVGQTASSRYKAAFAFGACAMVALLVTALTNAWVVGVHRTVGEWLQLVALNIVATLTTAWGFYARFFQPTGIAPALERTGPQLGDRSPPAGETVPR
ncbi:MAG: hypothetical protein M3Q65_02000 [Chloroflexota bacterium]|nr:hypothetical protein [Chloroflexota bacterium]